MKKTISFVAIFIATLVSMNAQATPVYNGADEHGRLCRVEFASIHAGPFVKHDACEFETDGPGPWCEGKPPVATRLVVGAGTYETIAGYVQFNLNDQWAISDASSISAAGNSNQGYVYLRFVGPKSVVVKHDFLTNYGKTLTPAQINNLLLHRAPGVTYESVYASIYTSVTCTAQLQ